jgi:hypothetical protein
VELVRERLLDVKLYRVRAGDQDGVSLGLEAVHEVYGTPTSHHPCRLPSRVPLIVADADWCRPVAIFTRFNALWVKTNPRDVMAFPTVFQSLKEDVRAELLAQSFRYY